MFELKIPESLPIGRGEALRTSIKKMHDNCMSNNIIPLIIEVGTIRDINPRAQFGDGWSSILWAWYAKEFGAEVHLIDVDITALDNCRFLIEKYLGEIPESVNIHQMDAADWLRLNKERISLLYLDGSDDPWQMFTQFSIVKKSNTFTEHAILILDDIGDNWKLHGKGTVLVPTLMRDEDWSLLVDDRIAKQMLFERV